MSNIRKAFENGKAFIPFITCGDPDLETTKAAVREMVKNGADLMELGIPFSDPTAEGPVIQEANVRALSGGVTTDKIFEMVKELRSGSFAGTDRAAHSGGPVTGDGAISGTEPVTVPMVFMTYANVVYSYGAERFLLACKDIGIDGIILPDLPFEEK